MISAASLLVTYFVTIDISLFLQKGSAARNDAALNGKKNVILKLLIGSGINLNLPIQNIAETCIWLTFKSKNSVVV